MDPASLKILVNKSLKICSNLKIRTETSLHKIEMLPQGLLSVFLHILQVVI